MTADAPAAILDDRLRALEGSGLRRTLRPPSGVDLCSNDYLGFARDAEHTSRLAHALADLPSGATGSRLLRGESELHEATEADLARCSGRDAAVLFPSGYQANVALLSSLLRPGDVVFSDRLNHASIIDGLRLGRALRRIYPHADVPGLRRLLEASAVAARGGAPGAAIREPGGAAPLRVIVTESLFSMDGDQAPLAALADLADEFSALLIVDEAHATGLFGRSGGGLVQALGLEGRAFATVHTGGKALGAGGAWIAGDRRLKEYLINVSRPFIFSTAPIPALCVVLRLAIERWRAAGPERAADLLRRAARLRGRLGRLAAGPAARYLEAASGPILPFVLGDNRRAVAVSEALRRRGFDARAIRPPTVPDGTARLRLTVNWPVPEETHERFAAALEETLHEPGQSGEPAK